MDGEDGKSWHLPLPPLNATSLPEPYIQGQQLCATLSTTACDHSTTKAHVCTLLAPEGYVLCHAWHLFRKVSAGKTETRKGDSVPDQIAVQDIVWCTSGCLRHVCIAVQERILPWTG